MLSVSLHYLEKYKCKNLTIIDSKRVGKQNTLSNKNAVNNFYDAILC